ncbi:uroporphyrinogen-III synthase-like [Anthonomus grandis grandis]|uniref:uroporphyrinogen-III synthase-like n=1 Tax=Anthonomus grandis grandis TaxID=2921223 RepID=UPI002165062C|nr:uroporphyrinogen-III synthase-like [Anthonomus grandis grandis]
MIIVPNSILLIKSQTSEDVPDKYETLLRSNNFKVSQVRSLVFTFKNLKKLGENLISGAYSGLILSSPRCVEAVRMAAPENSLPQWRDKHNFVVGEATYKSALEQLALDCLGKESGNGVNLAKKIVENKSEYDQPFLYPHGNLKSDTLNLELEKEGIQVVGQEVYDTVSNPNIPKELATATNNFQNVPEFIVFFSPSGVSSCIDLIGAIKDKVKFIAIGPVTEKTLIENNVSVFGVCKKPNPEELLKVILHK